MRKYPGFAECIEQVVILRIEKNDIRKFIELGDKIVVHVTYVAFFLLFFGS